MANIIRREKIGWGKNPNREYPVVKCDCGAEVHCDNAWANPCEDCDREYGSGGYQLAPRSQWGEETGETFY
jgi:hypothetical protein